MLHWMLKQLTAANRLTILIYHQVLAEPDPLFPGQMHAARFAQHMALLQRYFSPLPLSEAVQRLQQHRLPRAAVAVTFDDGYANNLDVALPILQQYGITATCFIATGFSDGQSMWNDIISDTVRHATASAKTAALNFTAFGRQLPPALPLQDVAQLIQALLMAVKYLPPAQRLAIAQTFAADNAFSPQPVMMQPVQLLRWHQAGMELGAHTVNHPILATLDDNTAATEISQSKQQLSALGVPVNGFAYPNGRFGKDFGQRDMALVQQAGFDFAVSTNSGSNGAQQDKFALRRFTPWDTSMLKFHARLALQSRRTT
ncbi:polysaccharide deacetylase family protein [Rheinheimera sp. NSM]|uniref:polysaccharide deacetylase family protein n=1 Tax=Rheinheimera sp. NSM TaxID=3457884 RepID=UPI0040365FDC